MADKPQGWKRTAALAGRFLDSKTGTLLVSLAFTLGMIYRYVLPLNAILLPGWVGNDCYQMVWNLWFANESITHGHNPYVTDLIYYPLGANLSHHSLALGFFPITFLIKLITRADPMYPFYAYRIIILVSFTLILYFSYLLLRQLNLSRWASAIAAAAYAFSDFYILHSQHLNHVSGFFIPLTGLFAVRFYQRPASANALMAAVAAACSIYFTEFVLYIYLGALLLVVLMCLFRTERHQLREKLRLAGLKRLLPAGAAFILIQVPFALNLFRDDVLKPSYGESSFFSANLAGFFIPFPIATPLYGNIFGPLSAKITTGIPGYEVFLGIPLMIFTALGFLKSGNRLIRICAVLGLFFLTLSLGPTLKVFGSETGVPLPYSLLMRVPPFDLSRTPVRFFVVGLFFLMIVSAAGIAWLQQELTRRWHWRWSAAAMALLFVWVTAEAYSPIAAQTPFVPPRGLERVVAGPVINLPPYPNDGYAAMLQVFHRQPVGMGYVARITPARLSQFRELRRAMDRGGPVFCDRMKEMGFRNIIINPREVVDPRRWGDLASLDLSKCSINVVDLRAEAAQSGGAYFGPIEQPDNFPAYLAGTRIDFRGSAADKFLWYGWGDTEPEFRWTDHSRATIVFALDQVKPAVLRMEMGAFLVPGRLKEQRVNLVLNGHQIITITIKQSDSKEYSIALPAEFLQPHNVLRLELPDAEAPATLGINEDQRMLGVSVKWIEIDFLK